MNTVTPVPALAPRATTSLQRIALALVLFLAIWGARLGIVSEFGSDLPFWDQWSKEGDSLYPAWFERGEVLKPLFAPHNEHRIAPTLALDLAFTLASGQWDARVQCVASAALNAALLAGLFFWGLRRFPLPWALALGGLCGLIGIAPIVWENLLSGFQSQFYFLAGFSLLAIGGLVLRPALSRGWWLGLLAAVAALVSMGSGLLCVLPVLAIAAWRWLNPAAAPRRDSAITFAACVLVLLLGAWLHTPVAAHTTLRAHSIGQFADYALRCLSWPLHDQPWLAAIFWLPWLLLVTRRLRARDSSADTTADFLVAAGLWVLLQTAAVAYSRAGTGDLPANRYGDTFGLGLIISGAALAHLAPRNRVPITLAIVWGAGVVVSLGLASRTIWTTSLQNKRADYAAFVPNVRQFVRTDDFAAFEKQLLPFPNASWLARILRQPAIRAILPECVRLPLRVEGFDDRPNEAFPALPHRRTRTMLAAGEWRSAPIATTGRFSWWKIPVCGKIGPPGATLQLVAVKDGRVLQALAPAPHDSSTWHDVYVRAPREPALFLAQVAPGQPGFAFGEPVEVSTLSLWAFRLCQQGTVILVISAAAALLLAWGILKPRKSLSGAAAFPDTPPLRMKFFTLPALLVAALISVCVALPFLPAAKMRPDLFMLEVELTSSVDSTLRAYYDDGAGLREELSGFASVAASPKPTKIRMPLPPGVYRGLRLDPTEGAGRVVLHALRTVSLSGRTLDTLPLQSFRAGQQIESLRIQNNALEVVAAPGSNDPQLLLSFPSPLLVSAHWTDYARGSIGLIASIFAAFAALLFFLHRAPRLQSALAERGRRLADTPGRAVCLVAALSMLASSYPVAFLGKSLVSPNLGTVLLYDYYPTLPGYKSGVVTDVKLADVGAVMWQHVPFSMIQHRALLQGELPLWNRYNAGGVPLLAQGQSMFGDPLHFLPILANGAAWAWDLKYLLAKWLFATGLGLTVLALTRSVQRSALSDQLSAVATPTAPISQLSTLNSQLLPALLVAAAAPFIGFFLYRVNHPAFFSLCYAPWPLYCLVCIAQTETRRGLALGCAALVVANLALMNSGTVKEAYMLLACVNFSGACILLATPTTWRDRLFKFAALAWAGLIFVLLTAPIWATFLQTLKNAYTGYNAVSAYQIQPALLLGLFDEIFYRPLMQNNWVFSPSLNFALLLGLLYFVATLRLQFAHRTALALALSSLLPLSLAFGLLPPHWITTLPFLGNIAHLDNTFSCVLIVLWSVVAGVGFATAAQRLGTRDGRHDLIIAGLLLFVLVFAWIGFRQAAHRPIFGPIFTVHQPGQVLAIHPLIWDYLTLLLVAAVVIAFAAHGGFARRSFTPARALLLALAFSALLWRHGLHANNIGFESFTSRPTERVNFHARSGAMDHARTLHTREPGRGFGFYGHFHPGWTGTYGLETVHGPDALVNPYMRELATASGVQRMWDWRLYAEPQDVAKVLPFFDALNVRYYFDLKTQHPALAQSLRKVHSADLDVYESPTAWPRAFFTDRIDHYDQAADFVAKVRAATGRPFAAAQRTDAITQAALASIPSDVATRTFVPATTYRLTENTTSFTVKATSAGVIVLNEVLWPGDFRVELNGQKGAILRLNHAFRGVMVPAAGEYRVTFLYRPKNYPRNLTLCAVGAVLGLGSLVLAVRRPRAK